MDREVYRLMASVRVCKCGNLNAKFVLMLNPEHDPWPIVAIGPRSCKCGTPYEEQLKEYAYPFEYSMEFWEAHGVNKEFNGRLHVGRIVAELNEDGFEITDTSSAEAVFGECFAAFEKYWLAKLEREGSVGRIRWGKRGYPKVEK